MRVRLAFSILATCIAAVIATSCAQKSEIAPESVSGPTPPLAAPDKALLPTVKISPVVGWKAGETPTPASGVHVKAFATGLVHPRWLYVLPNGDVLVAETNRPPTPDEPANPIRAAFMNKAFAKAGADVPSPNRISLLRDKDGDGVAETKTDARLEPVLALRHGAGRRQAVHRERRRTRVGAVQDGRYADQRRRRSASPSCPARRATIIGRRAWSPRRMARSSTSASVPTATSPRTAWTSRTSARTILEIDAKTGASRVFASGLRNPVGIAWEPGTKVLYTVVNERDELGNDLVPDYLTSVKDGAFYGWPWSYYGAHVDTRVKPERPDMVAKAIAPDYALGPHVASLGLAFSAGDKMPAAWRNGAFIGLHGSWNRDPQSGYKVIFVPFANGKPAGEQQEVLTGFLDAQGNARGRPVGVAMAKDGALLVADDVGNVVWRVAP